MKSYRNCFRVGITGGIGSGKTTVCRMFEQLGIPVYDADYWAKWLIVNEPAIKSNIIGLLGNTAYQEDGSYDRRYVAEIVFKDTDKLKALNAIVHPALELHSLQWHQEKSKSGKYPYSLKEAALLIESGGLLHLNYLIVVVATGEERIQRVMKRDQIPEKRVLDIMQHQLTDEARIKHAQFVIQNEDLDSTHAQVQGIHQELLLHSF